VLLRQSQNPYNNMLEATRGLTRLALQCCTAVGRLNCLSVLTTLTDLQHLLLQLVVQSGVDIGEVGADDQSALASIPGSLFSQLVKLTHLELHAGTGGLTQSSFEHLGCLTALQHLGLTSMWTEPNGDWVPTAEGMVGLSQLTQLTCLDMDECVATFKTDITPPLTPLTNLRRLRLRDIDAVDPAVLACLRQLQHLELYSHKLLGQPSGVEALLAALQGLQQLTLLEIFHGDEPEPTAGGALHGAADAEAEAQAAAEPATGLNAAAAAAQAADAAARPDSALTASTQLQELCVDFYTVPRGVWQHVFPPGKQLPHLTSLEAGSSESLSGGPCMSSADLASMVRCCPGLASLNVESLAFKPGISLTPLQELRTLTKLHMFGAQDHDNADIAVQVAQLTWLKSLHVAYREVVSDG
jgi:hypothetical protein